METLIYIAIGIAYFIYQVMKESRKLKEQAQPKDQELPAPPVPVKPIISERVPEKTESVKRMERERAKKPPLSFDDILQEYEKKHHGRPARSEKLIKEKHKELTKEVAVQTLEKIESELETAKEILKERVPLADEHLNPYKLAKKGQNPYAALLKNPQSLRTAVVLSEILNKKYS